MEDDLLQSKQELGILIGGEYEVAYERMFWSRRSIKGRFQDTISYKYMIQNDKEKGELELLSVAFKDDIYLYGCELKTFANSR